MPLKIQRVGKKKFIVVESFRNEMELFNLQCWALTCQSFFSKKSGFGSLININIMETMSLFIFKLL